MIGSWNLLVLGGYTGRDEGCQAQSGDGDGPGWKAGQAILERWRKSLASVEIELKQPRMLIFLRWILYAESRFSRKLSRFGGSGAK